MNPLSELSNNLFETNAGVRDALAFGGAIQHFDADGNFFDRIVVDWNESTKDVKLTHRVAFTIDRENRIFLDCSKRLTCKKIFFSTLVRPLHTIVVIFDHVQAFRKSEGIKEKARIIGYIVSAPLFELALTIMGVASLILVPIVTPFDKSFIYRCRTAIGIVEKAMFRGERSEYFLAHCFQPLNAKDIAVNFTFYELAALKRYVLTVFPDTDYEGERPEMNEQFELEPSLTNLVEDEFVDNGYFVRALKCEYDGDALKDNLHFKHELARRAFVHLARANIVHKRGLKGCDPLRLFYSRLGANEAYITSRLT